MGKPGRMLWESPSVSRQGPEGCMHSGKEEGWPRERYFGERHGNASGRCLCLLVMH